MSRRWIWKDLSLSTDLFCDERFVSVTFNSRHFAIELVTLFAGLVVESFSASAASRSSFMTTSAIDKLASLTQPH